MNADRPAIISSSDVDARLRVVHAVDGLDIGGTETNAVRTAIALAARGITVHMAVFRMGPLAPRLTAAGIRIHLLPIRGIAHWTALRAIARFAALCRDVRADVVHCHDVYTNSLLTIGARLAGVPLVIASRRWGLAQYPPSLTQSSRLGYRFAHCVLANSATVAASVVDEEHVPRSRLVTVSNFVDDILWTADRAAIRAELRERLGVDADAPLVSMVARLSPEKDHPLAIAAFRQVLQAIPSARMVLVGGGPALDRVRAEIDSSGLTHAVLLAGEQPHGWRYHAAADAALLTSQREGFPNTIVEAMALGRPVVSTDVGGVRDAVHEGENGFVVPTGAVAPLAHALQTLLQDLPRARRMGAAGELRARANFSQEAVLSTLLEVYRRRARSAGPTFGGSAAERSGA